MKEKILVSIIVPAYNDPFLHKTIDSLLENSQSEIEIIVILDGYKPKDPVAKDPRVRIIRFRKNRGMRAAENAGIKIARGKYIMKSDSHCVFGPGYDRILAESCKPSWLCVPRRYSLDPENWIKGRNKSGIDYHYFTYPTSTNGGILTISPWLARKYEGKGARLNVDDILTFQGSCWFANKDYFMKHVGFLKYGKNTYSSFGAEQIEIGLKYWLGGGRVKVVKTAWYAHFSKRRRHYAQRLFSREYKQSYDAIRGHNWATQHWMNNKEPGMKHTFSWLIEKFWPLPGWPEDRSLWISPKNDEK